MDYYADSVILYAYDSCWHVAKLTSNFGTALSSFKLGIIALA